MEMERIEIHTYILSSTGSEEMGDFQDFRNLLLSDGSHLYIFLFAFHLLDFTLFQFVACDAVISKSCEKYHE